MSPQASMSFTAKVSRTSRCFLLDTFLTALELEVLWKHPNHAFMSRQTVHGTVCSAFAAAHQNEHQLEDFGSEGLVNVWRCQSWQISSEKQLQMKCLRGAKKKSCFFSLKVPLRVRHKWMWAQNELITASPSPRVLGRHKVEGKGSRWAESLVSFSTPF